MHLCNFGIRESEAVHEVEPTVKEGHQAGDHDLWGLGGACGCQQTVLSQLFVWDWEVCEPLTSVTVSFWVMAENSSSGSPGREQEPDMTASDRL